MKNEERETIARKERMLLNIFCINKRNSSSLFALLSIALKTETRSGGWMYCKNVF